MSAFHPRRKEMQAFLFEMKREICVKILTIPNVE